MSGKKKTIKNKVENIPKKKGLMNFFGKFKKKMFDRNVGEDLINEVSEEEENTSKYQEKLSKMYEKVDPNIKIEIDRIKMQVEAFDQVRKITGDRFIRVGEEMGEFRSYALGLEKELKDIMISINKSVDLVNAVQPQLLLAKVEEQKATIESNKIKIQTFKELHEKVMDELKSIRSKMNLFRGYERVLELYREMEDINSNILKTKSIIEKYSDKIMSTFVSVKKHFNDFKTYKNLSHEMNHNVRSLSSEFDKLKGAVGAGVTEEEMTNFKNEINEISENLSNDINSLKEGSLKISDDLNAKDKVINNVLKSVKFDHLEKIKKLQSQMKTKDSEIKELKKMVKSLNVKQDGILKKLSKK